MGPDWSMDRAELLAIAGAAERVAAEMPIDGSGARSAAVVASFGHRSFTASQASTAATAALERLVVDVRGAVASLGPLLRETVAAYDGADADSSGQIVAAGDGPNRVR